MYRANHSYNTGMDSYGYSGNSPGMDSYGSGGNITHVAYRKNSGYFQRVGNSVCGIFFGFIVILCAFPALFLNEGRAVQTARSLDEGLNTVVEVSSKHISQQNDQKLIYLYGKLSSYTALTDEEFDITLFVIKLRRNVEMYQWVEHEHKREYKEGDRTRIETTYSYSNEWKSEVINSGSFSNSMAHRNPNSFPISSYTKVAEPAFIDEFKLSPGLLSKITDFHRVQLKSVPSGRKDLVLLDGYYYRSADAYRPKVGDIRISFSYAGVSGTEESDDSFKIRKEQDVVSVVAQQQGRLLTPYHTEAGDVLQLMYPGRQSVKAIFDAEHSTNFMLTWFIRFLGWLMMFIGLQIMMDIVRQIVSFLPIVREIVGLATSLIAITLATTLTLITIAVGWLRYRPLFALALFVGAAVPLYMSRKKADKEKRNSDIKN